MSTVIKPGTLFVISAPSGAGKTSLVNAVLNELQKQQPITRLITYTSRQPRVGEVDGVHYHFINKDDFEAKIKENFFIEWSVAYGTYYGSPRHCIDQLGDGISYITIVDRVGARAISKQVPQAVLIWIYTQSVQDLRSRLMARGQDAGPEIERRLLLATQEIADEAKTNLFQHHVLNDNFDVAVKNIKTIITRFS